MRDKPYHGNFCREPHVSVDVDWVDNVWWKTIECVDLLRPSQFASFPESPCHLRSNVSGCCESLLNLPCNSNSFTLVEWCATKSVFTHSKIINDRPSQQPQISGMKHSGACHLEVTCPHPLNSRGYSQQLY